jgi:2-polyprenyl-3-methyl-5-hydroxy-6-metoxy-1,4-benzoquinol methylase
MAVLADSPAEPRFAFGDNWRSFLALVDEHRIRVAEDSLKEMLDLDTLTGKSFLDAGCGSGLFSLAACRLGAERVVSFDFDPESVACAQELRSRFSPPDSSWEIARGDVTDGGYCRELGQFDVVYSWGVLHHTGSMWKGLDNVCSCVNQHGLLFVAIYNDQGRRSRMWRRVKRAYNRAPARARPAIAALAILPRELKVGLVHVVEGRPGDYVRSWRAASGRRGMNRWHNIVDWVGGYPFEVAKPEQVFEFCRSRDFELIRLATVAGDSACNQFVFVRRDPTPNAS